MKKIYIQSLFVLLALLIGNFSYAQKTKSQTQELKGTAKSFVKAEAIKAYETKLARILIAEANDPVVKNTMKKIWESAKGLNKQQVKTLFERFTSTSRQSLKNLIKLSPSQMSSYVKDVTSTIKVDAKTLKKIIYGTGNKAGNAVLKTLSEMDEILTKTGKLPKHILKAMRDEASGLNPKQAKAFYNLLKKKMTTDWANFKDLKNPSKGPAGAIGTVVDGVFVLFDAYDIYNSDEDPEIKGIKATSKIIDYGSSTGAGVASAALGGGLGPGLVIAFSANRVSTLYTEVAMLQKELQDIEDTIENRKINNGVFARGQLIKISQLIKLGQLKNAKFKLIKLRKFLKNNDFKNRPMLSKLRYNLEEKLEKAKYNERVNIEINKARFPYIEAYNYYKKGVELNIAKHEANQALKMLRNSAKSYPEINKLQAIPRVKSLLVAINKKIANASELLIAKIKAPKKVYVGQYIDILVLVNGGIPYYYTDGILGNISQDNVTAYWQAPSKPGKEKFNITIKDCMGKTASKSVSIEVVEKDEEVEEVEDEEVILNKNSVVEDNRVSKEIRKIGFVGISINFSGTGPFKKNNVVEFEDIYDNKFSEIGFVFKDFKVSNNKITAKSYKERGKSGVDRNTEQMEIELIFKDVNNFKSLKGFSFKRIEIWDDYNYSTNNNSAIVKNIPFKIYDDNYSLLNARYEGDISKYLNEFVFKWRLQNHNEKYFTSGELKKLDKQGKIDIDIHYKIEKK